jgi:hypothetical protein
MNERLAAMMELARMRDALVLKLLIVSGVLLVSAGALHASNFKPQLRAALIHLQAAIVLTAWLLLFVILRSA